MISTNRFRCHVRVYLGFLERELGLVYAKTWFFQGHLYTVKVIESNEWIREGYTKSVDLELIETQSCFCFSSCEKREAGRSRAVRLKWMKQAIRGVVQATTIECQKSTRKRQKARAASTQTRNYCSGLSLLFLGSSQRSIAFSAAHRKTISQSHIARVLFPSFLP